MSLFDNTPVRTPADELLEIVRKKGKLTIEEASRLLRMPLDPVQGLVDFLVEEKILGIEYKFTTPYIYLNEEDMASPPSTKLTTGLVTKEDFWKQARKRNIPTERIEMLWKKYLNENLPAIQKKFKERAKMRGLNEAKTNALWKKYLNSL